MDSDIVNLNDNTAKEVSKLIRKFVSSYTQKPNELDDKEWLKNELKSELSYLSDEEAEKLSEECFSEIKNYDNNLKSLQDAVKSGESKESWFNRKSKEAASGMSVNEFGEYLKAVDETISISNLQMHDVVINTRGNQQISKNMNLDGFIAEQYHVSSFNMKASLNNSEYRAKVLEPKVGETYAKNSFDVVIVDANDKIVHQYQLKYGKTAEHTINMIKKGNYNNQRIVVPEEQVEAVKAAFPNKSIESHIGGTDKVKIESSPLTKSDAKDIQYKTQEEGTILSEDWNHFKTKELSINIAKNASIAGIQAAAISSGFEIAKSVIDGEEIDADKVVSIAISTGADTGIKAATAGALHVGIEKGMINVIPKGTPMGTLVNISCVAIENLKIIGKVADGELTSAEALDKMGMTSLSMIYGLSWSAKGAAALSWIPIVGPLVGGLVGGTVGYMAGSKFGEKVYEVGKKVASKAKEYTKKIGNTIKSCAQKVRSGVKSIGRSIAGGIRNFFR